VGAAAILLVVGNGPFTYASGLGWNHDLPVLLTLGALVCFLRAGDGRSRLVFAGALLGLAVGTRIAFAPALAPFLVAAALPPPAAPAPDPSPAPARRAIQLRAPGALLAGVVLGLAPSGVLAVLAPARFLFDNVAYHFWNAAYWQASAPGAPERLTDKLGYLRDLLLAQPACLALGLLYALVALPPLAWAVARGRLGAHRPLALAAALVPCLLLGALVPSPTWYQYFYAPVPFMALAVALGLGTIWGIGGARARLRRVGAGVALGIGAALALVNGVQVYSGYLRDAGFPQPAGWVPLQVHQTGLEIRRLLDTSGSGRGRAQVLTLLPLYPLEGGLAIYPALASGPFAWRVAPLLPSDQRPALQVAGAPDLAALVGPAGPAAVLTGSEGALDAPLTAYALAHDYHPARLPDGLTLWMK